MHVYVRSLVRPVVEVGPSPAIPATPEMALRPAGLAAVSREVERYHVDEERLRAFDRPVYMSYGGLSSERWETMGARLAVLFPDCTVERYEGCHHLNTSHQAEPERVAGALKQLWSRRRAERLHPAPVAPPAAPAAARPSVLRDRPAETVSRAARDLRTRLLTWRDGTHGCALLGCLAVLYGQIQASADQVPGELRGNQPWRST